MLGLYAALLVTWQLVVCAVAQSDAASAYQAYPLRQKPAAEAEAALNEMLVRLGVSAHVVADARNNQLLVRGPELAQNIARQLVDSLDRGPATGGPAVAAQVPAAQGQALRAPAPTPPATSSSPLAVPQPVFKAYACPPGRSGDLANRLRAALGNRSDVRIAADAQDTQIMVLAPTDVHQSIPQHLAALQAVAPPPAVVTQPAAPVPPVVNLSYTRTEQLEPQMVRLLSGRLIPAPSTTGMRGDYIYTDAAGKQLVVSFDRPGNRVALHGAEGLAGQFVRLVQSLDQPPQPNGRALRMLPVHRADPAKVEEAVRAYRSSVPMDSGRPVGSELGIPPIPPDAAGRPGIDQGGHHPHNRVDLVNYLYQQQPAAGAAGPAGAAPIPVVPGKDPGMQQSLRALGADVEVEVLPDLDVLILRGREQDVQELAKIIEELERISAETQPSIEVVPLKNAGSEQLMTIAAKVADSLTAGLQGRVVMTPLAKPNAVLLVGWGEAVKAAKELIQKLDVPAAPDAQYRVFALKYATASVVRTTLQEFYLTRSGAAAGASAGLRVVISADPRANSIIVQAPPREMNEIALLIESMDRQETAAVNQMRIFPLRFTLAVDLAATLQAAIDSARGATPTAKTSGLELITVDPAKQKAIRSGVLTDVRIIPDPRLNILLVSGPAQSMDLVAALIEQLDVAVAAAQIKVFRIVNGDAASLVTMLRALLPQGGPQVGPQLSSNVEEGGITSLRFSVDFRTNSIIAVGAGADLRIVEALLLRLDEQDVAQRRNAVYRLKNAPALDVANAINEFLRSERQLQQAAPGAVSATQQIESEVVVVPEPVSNSLILSATPRYFQKISDLIEKLDAQPPQVLIQVMIAQVDLSNFSEFGAEFGLQDSVLFDRSLIGNLVTTTRSTTQTLTGLSSTSETQTNIIGASNSPGYAFNGATTGNSGAPSAVTNSSLTGGQSLTNFNMGRVNSTLGFGGLVLSASSESVSVLLRALQETQCLEILSRPQIMTLDNQPAYIQVGRRVPRIVGTSVTNSVQVNSITLENVGLILGVTPRISPDGMVVMELDAERSELGPEAEGIPVSVSAQGAIIRSPFIDVTTAQTTISASTGETVMLGGLITKNTKTDDRKVPLLADMPVVGNLFRYKSSSVRRTELLIVLTPHVVRGAADLERVKQVEASRMHWCLKDVQQIHGNLGLNPTLGQPHGTVIYPDDNPRGTLPEPARPGDKFDVLPSPPEPIPAPQSATPAGPQVVPTASGPTPAPAKPAATTTATPVADRAAAPAAAGQLR